MTVSQLIHIWANQSQPSGRSGNVFFEGPVLYSYGYHYPIGVLVEHKRETVALINDSSSSRTTNSHVQAAKVAANHYKQLRVVFDTYGINSPSHPSFMESWLSEGMFNATRRHFKEEIEKSYKKMLKSRTDFNKNYYLELTNKYLNNFNDLLSTFRKYAPKGMRKLQLPGPAKSKEEIKKAAAADRIRRKKELEKKRAEFEESLAQWKGLVPTKTGSSVFLPTHYSDFPIHLRVHKRLHQMPIIQTSHGAEVHYDQAVELYQLVMRFRRNPQLKTRINGAMVGRFTVTSMNDKGIKIGCHFITWEIIDEFAKEQGWITEEKASA